jgi:hypothetical protein
LSGSIKISFWKTRRKQNFNPGLALT